MTPVEPLLRLRPLGLGEILDDIFRVYRRHFWLLVGIALVLSVPTLLLQFASGSAEQFGFVYTVIANLANPDAIRAASPPSSPNLLVLGVAYLVLIVLVPFTLGGIAAAAIELALGNPVSVRSALLAVARRYWALFGLTLLLLAVTPTVICLPVLIFLAVRWVVAIPALLAEGIGPVRALGRSWRLTQGSWWRLFGIVVVLYLLQYAAGAALGAVALPLAVVVPFVPPFVRGAIVLTLSTAAQAVVLPVVYLGVVLLYFDLRIRREDFDLDQLARQAAGPT